MSDRGQNSKPGTGGARAASQARAKATGAAGRGRSDGARPQGRGAVEVPGAPGQDRDRVGRYRIGAVAGATGIAAHTLRVWERRYGAFATARTEGGTRLYSEADVQRARVLAQLQQRGHAIGDIAGLPDPELATLLTAGGIEGPTVPLSTTRAGLQQAGEAFLEAVQRFDLVGAERMLRAAIAGSEPRALVLELLPQLLEAIGQRWETGAYGIAHEHAASALIRDALGELLHAWRPATPAGTVVAATLSGELHEFGALLAALLASLCGWRPVYLGPNLPAEEIVLAAARVRARVVLVSLVCARGSRACEGYGDQLTRLRNGLPERCELLVGGAAALRIAREGPGLRRIDDLPGLEHWLLAGRR